MPILFEAFAQACANERVVLDERIRLAGKRGRPSSLSSMHDSAPLMGPIVEAGIVLRENPDAQLADRPLTSPFPGGTLAAILQTIVNTSIAPRSRSRDVPQLTSGPIDELDSCGIAEDRFRDVGYALSAGQPNVHCDIYMWQDRPVLVRKNKGHGVPSALSLRSIAINGVVYPQHSLLRVEAEGDTWLPGLGDHNDETHSHVLRTQGSGVRVRPLSDIPPPVFCGRLC